MIDPRIDADSMNEDQLSELVRADIERVASRHVRDVILAANAACQGADSPTDVSLALLVAAAALAKAQGCDQEIWATIAAEVWSGVHVAVIGKVEGTT